MILSIFRTIADSKALTAAVVLVELFVVGFMAGVKTPAVEKFTGDFVFPKGRPIPDIWFGFVRPDNLLADYFTSIGDEGRLAYLSLSAFGSFPFMETYALLLGTFLIKAARRLKVRDEIAYAAPLTMFFDMIENFVLYQACNRAPDSLDHRIIAIGSLANQLKWILCASSLLFFVGARTYIAIAERPGSGLGKTDKKE